MATPIGQSDPTQASQAKVYIKQGGIEEVIDVGGVQTQLGVANLNGVNLPNKVSFAIAPGATNVATITITVTDNAGAAVPFPWDFDVCLSDAASGAGLAAHAASGGIAATTGIIVSTYTAGKDVYVQTAATGVVVLTITDTAKTGYYVMAQTPGGFPAVSRQLVTGDYGP